MAHAEVISSFLSLTSVPQKMSGTHARLVLLVHPEPQMFVIVECSVLMYFLTQQKLENELFTVMHFFERYLRKQWVSGRRIVLFFKCLWQNIILLFFHHNKRVFTVHSIL